MLGFEGCVISWGYAFACLGVFDGACFWFWGCLVVGFGVAWWWFSWLPLFGVGLANTVYSFSLVADFRS